jgi:hypothetical protein
MPQEFLQAFRAILPFPDLARPIAGSTVTARLLPGCLQDALRAERHREPDSFSGSRMRNAVLKRKIRDREKKSRARA